MGKPSTVCEETLTEGRIRCHLCGQSAPVRELGYMPVYRSDNITCVLILHEYTFEQVGRLPFLSNVSWGRREDDVAEAVFVQPMLRPVKYETTLKARLRPQDITIAIARYWRRPDLLPDLVKWFGSDVQQLAPGVPAELAARVTANRKREASPPDGRSGVTLAELTGEVLQPLIGKNAREMLRRNKLAATGHPPNGVSE